MFTYILPFYSDGRRLEKTLKTLKSVAEIHSIKQVILAHNGPKLSDHELANLKKDFWPGVEYVHNDNRGVGAGCKVAVPQVNQKYLIITGSDLPFEFTDLAGFKNELQRNADAQVMIGSKGHPTSKISGNGLPRKIMSHFFWMIRKLCLGWKSPRDTQGSIFLESRVAKELNAKCYIDNYLYTMEIVTRAQKQGLEVIEVPVICDMQAGGGSSVSVIKDSLKSLWEILKFSLKLRSEVRSGNGKQNSPYYHH